MPKNFAYSLVATAPSPATSGTSLVVTGGQGALFPTVPFQATIWPANLKPLTTNAEIVTVTGVSTDTLTIVRAQEGATARSVIIGDQIAATITNLNMPTSGILLDGSGTDNDYVLRGSQNLMALDHFEVGVGNTLETPSTSTMEVVAYGPAGSAEPTGVITMYGGTSPPSGWLICDGTAYSRTTYATLFAVISTTYGVGDASTTFNVPDFRGRSPMGSGTGTATGATAHAMGSQPTTSIGGEETHVQQIGEMVLHTHNVNVSGVAGIAIPLANGGAVGATNTTSSAGSSTAANITHPISTVNFIIKT